MSSSDAAEIQRFCKDGLQPQPADTEVPVTGNPADIHQEPQFDAFESAGAAAGNSGNARSAGKEHSMMRRDCR
ncbi:MAG: hypothetical protein ACLSFT_12295 [Ruminococcus callidus]